MKLVHSTRVMAKSTEEMTARIKFIEGEKEENQTNC
jgi:hypothetical protein